MDEETTFEERTTSGETDRLHGQAMPAAPDPQVLARAHDRLRIGILTIQKGPDGGHRVVFANRYAATMLGRPRQALLERPPHPAFIEHQDERSYTVRLTGPDGHPTILEVAQSRDDHAGAPAIHVVFRDVTDRERTFDALRKSQERVRTVLDHTPVALMVVDPERGITMLRGGALETLGIDADKAVGSSVSDIEAALPTLGAAVHRAFAGETVRAQATYADHHYELTCCPIREREGLRVAVIAHDVTPLLDAVERQVAAERAAEQERFRGIVLNRLAHELNTPLTVLTLSLGPLAHAHERFTAEEHAATARRALAAGRRLRQVVSQILDALRATAPILPEECGRTDLDDLLRRCVADKGEAAHRAGVKLARRPREGDVHAVVVADLVHEALGRLLDNAICAAPAGSTVFVQARGGDGHVQLEIIDRGPGTDRKILRTLEGPLPMESTATTVPPSPGLGLGLYVARNIAQRHGGILRLETPEDGPGTKAVLVFSRDGPETISGGPAKSQAPTTAKPP